MDKEIPYVSIDGKDHLPREEYERIEKRRRLKFHYPLGLANLTVALGIPVGYAGYAQGSGERLVGILQNSNLESLFLWGGLFLVNSAGAYLNLYKVHQLRE